MIYFTITPLARVNVSDEYQLDESM